MTTHNGRGQDGISGIPGDSQLPAATTPREGVVLPAHGDPWTPEQQQQVQAAQAQVQPPAGQPWGQPWGPGSTAGPVPGEQPTGGGQPASGGQQYGGAQPLPPEGAPAPPPPPPSHAPDTYGQALPGSDTYGQALPGSGPDTYGQAPPGTGPDTYGQALPGTGTDAYGQAYPPHSLPGAGSHGQLPPAPGEYGQLPPAPGEYGQPSPGTGAHGMRQPGADGAYGQPAHGTQGGRHALPPTGGHPPSAVPPAAPPPPSLPPEQPQGGDAESTQMLPPITGEGPQHIGMAMDARQGHGQGPGHGRPGSEDGTQLLPPQPAAPTGSVGAADSEATQYIPPVTDDPDAAHMLRAPLPSEGGAHGAGQGQSQGGSGEGERRPLPEFDNLFRAEPSARGEADDSPGSTQSLPIFDQAAAQQHERQQAGYGQGPGQGPGHGHGAPGFDPYEPQGRAARRDAQRGRSRGRRTIPPGVLIGAGLAGVAVIGLLVGISLSGGDDTSPTASEKDASTAPAKNEKPSSPPPDPALAQSKKLDALLADSNNSRAKVVSSVERIKSCKMLGKAAADLRGAAQQRNGLVKRLGELKTDKIPNSAQLNAQLTAAWKSSASADNHYAAWADQTAKKHGCHKGKARGTGQAVAGNRASGAATTAKKKAAGLWNPTAKKYGLTERQFSEL